MLHRHATAIVRDASGVTATLDWYGCATFRLTLGDLVVFLDAYIDRAPGAPGTGLTADDVDRADWILVGHSHFDHLWGAERIARNTGATIVGSYESIRMMAEQGVPDAAADAGGGRRTDPPVGRRDGDRVPVPALVRLDQIRRHVRGRLRVPRRPRA